MIVFHLLDVSEALERYGFDGEVLLDNSNTTVHQITHVVVVFFEPDVERNAKFQVLIDDNLNDKVLLQIDVTGPVLSPALPERSKDRL